MTTRLTEQTVKALPAPAAGNRITYDDDPRGFGVRVTRGGAKAFVLNYRINGRERRITIGRFPDWTVAAARDEAKRLRRRVDVGEDPLRVRIEARDAPTMANLCDDYLERHAPKKRTGADDRRRIERVIRPRLGRRLAAEITTRDIEDLHRSMKAAPYEANRTVAQLHKMFELAIRWEWRADNPCKGIERYPEEKRERYLTPDEIGRLAGALAEHPDRVAANAVRLLLLTGARKSEVLRATWEQFDLEAGVWTKPSSHTKQKREHRVPLSPPALQLLSDMRRYRKGDLVFPGRGPDEPIKDLKRAWPAICKRAELRGVRVHDLRHTYASILVSSGLSLPVIGRLLGHTQAVTTARYAHLYDDPLREATSRVGALVEAVENGKRGAEVVPLKREGGQ